MLIGIGWGVTVSGRSYNDMMQEKKVPPIINLQNNNERYKISLMGKDIVDYPTVQNPISPEKAKKIINRMSTVSRDNRAVYQVYNETNRNLIELWRKSYFSKKNKNYQIIMNDFKKKVKPLTDVKMKIRNVIKFFLPNEDK